MATITKQWQDGGGNVTLEFGGSGDGTIVVSSDPNSLRTARSMNITVKTTGSGEPLTQTITVSQAAKALTYLTFTALEAGTFTLTVTANTNNLKYLEYSLDNGASWIRTTNDGNTITITTPTLQAGEKVMWRGSGNRLCDNNSTNYPSFSSTGRFNASGSIMSLLYVDDVESQYARSNAFRELFRNCTTIVTAPELPALYIESNAYYSMFKGCTALTTSPELPFTTVDYAGCYQMFYGCTSLTTATSELKPTIPGGQSYYGMFQNCTSLTTAPKIMATSFSAKNNCYYMFKGCSSLATVHKLYVTNVGENSCREMYMECTSLKNIPSDMLTLATTVGQNGCNGMFSGCTSLENTTNIGTTTTAYAAFAYMYRNCASLLSTPNELPATTLSGSCYRQMFYGCTSITEAPVLPALTLANQAYQEMFDGCTHLAKIKMMATNISATNCLANWVRNVASTGTFIKNVDATWTTTGVSGVPSGWTIQTEAAQ